MTNLIAPPDLADVSRLDAANDRLLDHLELVATSVRSLQSAGLDAPALEPDDPIAGHVELGIYSAVNEAATAVVSDLAAGLARFERLFPGVIDGADFPSWANFQRAQAEESR
jgi:hypothetical protein